MSREWKESSSEICKRPENLSDAFIPVKSLGEEILVQPYSHGNLRSAKDQNRSNCSVLQKDLKQPANVNPSASSAPPPVFPIPLVSL